MIDQYHYPGGGGKSVHVIDELLVIHQVHLCHELLLDDLGHSNVVLVVSSHLEQLTFIYPFYSLTSTDLCDSLRWPLTQCSEKVLLEPVVDVLCDLVTLGADVDCLVSILGRGDIPSINWSHHYTIYLKRLVYEKETEKDI